ncbi:hypothetical protein FA95DRAFT_1596078 [Auriscalpium vulgare]|uniref:Uncharacterized protein n=1 Tax=Auriscalpium vulgare TaxID=40419 RepID=A0ACB8RRJ9_9AGAM|nr:hypothetical protein FA95DRAFT_1596078 [Auriscalpium vulgare]
MNAFQLNSFSDRFQLSPSDSQALAALAASADMSMVEHPAQTSGFQGSVGDQAIDCHQAIDFIPSTTAVTGYDAYDATPFATFPEVSSIEQAHYPPAHFHRALEPIPSSPVTYDAIPTYQPIYPNQDYVHYSPAELPPPPPPLVRNTRPQPLHLHGEQHDSQRKQRMAGHSPYFRRPSTPSTPSTAAGPWTPESPAFPVSAASGASAHVRVVTPSVEPTDGAYAGLQPTNYMGATIAEMLVARYCAEDADAWRSQWASSSEGSSNMCDVMPVISGDIVPDTAGYMDFRTPEIASGMALSPNKHKFENEDQEKGSLDLPVLEALRESVTGPSNRMSTKRSKAKGQSTGRRVQKEGSSGTAEQPVICGFKACGRELKGQASLKRHTETVHGDKNPICSGCKHKFSRRDALKRHQRKCTSLSQVNDAPLPGQKVASEQSQSGR